MRVHFPTAKAFAILTVFVTLTTADLVGRDRVEIAHDSIPGATEIRVETAGICRWRVSPIRAELRDQPHYTLIRHDGSIAFRKSFWGDGVVQSTVMDMAPLDNGGAVVAGGMIQTDGAIARGVMVLAPDGSVERFIRLNNYIPRHVAAGADESIWVVGPTTSQYHGGPRSDRGVFRKYDLNGQFLGEFVLRSSFPQGVHPSGKSGPGGRSFLRRVGEGIGFYSGIATEWTELDADGQVVHRVTLPPVLVQFLAVTDSGRVLGWIAGLRFGIYELARDAHDWTEVPGWVGTIDAPPPVGSPRGVDGERIAIQELPALPNLRFFGIPE